MHYPVPCRAGQSLLGINVRFKAGIDSKVTQVNLYMNDTLQKSFTGSWLADQDLTFNFKIPITFNGGLGISIKCESGPDGGVGRFIFYRAGANLN